MAIKWGSGGEATGLGKSMVHTALGMAGVIETYLKGVGSLHKHYKYFQLYNLQWKITRDSGILQC